MRSVLVTGASSGIGRATALCLDRVGWTVWAGVRDESDGDRLALESGPHLRAIGLDITDARLLERARDEIRSATGLDAIVNNAGIGVAGPLELLSDGDLRAQYDVNVIGQLAVTRTMLPLLRESPDPRILFVSSVGGKMAFPFAGAYTSSKFALEAIGDALRVELEPEDIPVVLVEPPSISTPIWDKARTWIGEMRIRDSAGVYRERLAEYDRTLESLDESGGDPDEVAETILKVLNEPNPSARYPVGLQARLVAPLRALLPDALADRVAGRAVG